VLAEAARTADFRYERRVHPRRLHHDARLEAS
jgi:hypothetical protein